MRAKRLRQGITIGILLIVAFWLASLIYGLIGKTFIAVSEARNAQRQYQTLEERKAALEASLAALLTPRGKDAAVRTAFGVARPGEEVIVVVPPTTATATPPAPWWRRILDWLGQRN